MNVRTLPYREAGLGYLTDWPDVSQGPWLGGRLQVYLKCRRRAISGLCLAILQGLKARDVLRQQLLVIGSADHAARVAKLFLAIPIRLVRLQEAWQAYRLINRRTRSPAGMAMDSERPDYKSALATTTVCANRTRMRGLPGYASGAQASAAGGSVQSN